MSQLVVRPQDSDTLKSTIMETALDHSLMSAYTAFVAVDSMSRTTGNYGTSVPVPVPVPEGVKYETTVGSNGSN